MRPLTAAPTNDNTSGLRPEVPSIPTAGHNRNLSPSFHQSTLFELLGQSIPVAFLLAKAGKIQRRAQMRRDVSLKDHGETCMQSLAGTGLSALAQESATVFWQAHRECIRHCCKLFGGVQ